MRFPFSISAGSAPADEVVHLSVLRPEKTIFTGTLAYSGLPSEASRLAWFDRVAGCEAHRPLNDGRSVPDHGRLQRNKGVQAVLDRGPRAGMISVSIPERRRAESTRGRSHRETFPNRNRVQMDQARVAIGPLGGAIDSTGRRLIYDGLDGQLKPASHAGEREHAGTDDAHAHPVCVAGLRARPRCGWPHDVSRAI